MTVRIEYPSAEVILIQIDRSDSLNALDLQTFGELGEAWDTFSKSTRLRVAVVTGSGSRAFCAGADLSIVDLLAQSDDLDEIYRSMLAIDVPEKPILAAINGHAIGGGLTLALGCDFRIASPNATFGLPISKLASHPQWLLPSLLAQIPDGVAMRMLLLGDRISAAEALSAGLVSEVISSETLLDRAIERADAIARLDPLAVASLLSSIRLARAGWPELQSHDNLASLQVMKAFKERRASGRHS